MRTPPTIAGTEPVPGGLTSAFSHAGTADTPTSITREAAREAAERELTKPIYHQHDPNLVQRAITWFWDKVGGLIGEAAGATPAGWVGLATIAAVVGLALIALRLRLGRLAQATTGRSALFATRPRSAAQHRAAAEAHAEQHRWSEAVQERMRAIVRGLEERAVLDPRPGRTADEAATEAARVLPQHGERLRAAARSFDDVRYGGHRATELTYRELRDLDTDLARAKPLLPTSGAAR